MAIPSVPQVESRIEDVETLPTGVDEAAVARLRTVAMLLDDSVRIPGTNIRFGLDPVLGVIPGAGDAVAAGLSLYIIIESARLGVPVSTLVRMLVNVAIDGVFGSIPFFGDLFDVAFKANRRNANLAIQALEAERER